ncbi:MAG: hypothetical protein VXY73_12010 [Pseudomonadota bacterium]|jgi:opacity protein-like surface antigen|nr:hypothetical protein [Pseudomonadota bacterium]
MNRFILSAVAVLGLAAPAFADDVQAPGYANATAAKILGQLQLEGDDFNEGLAKYVGQDGQKNSNVTVSSRSAVNARAAEIFAQLADEDNSRNNGLSIRGTKTAFSGEVVNPRAAEIFEALDLADDAEDTSNSVDSNEDF